MSQLAAIVDIGQWDALSRADRLRAAEELCTRLGPEFRASRVLVGKRRLAAVVHVHTRVAFVAVPGGRLRMGITAAELDRILSLAGEAAKGEPAVLEDLREQLSSSRPVHDVVVRPFLCARAPLLAGLAREAVATWETGADRALFDDPKQPQARKPAHLTRAEAASTVKRLRFRIVSEAEWEWLAREGGRTSWVCEHQSSQDWRPHRAAAAQCAMEAFVAGSTDPDVVNGFGIWGLLWGEWVADAIHRNYEGAPAVASAWDAGPEPQMLRAFGAATFWPWQNPGELIACHAGFRTWTRERSQAACVRFALDLPPLRGSS
jgi:hypothetical protein